MSTLLNASRYDSRMSPETRRLRDWLIEQLEVRDMTQADLARAVGVSNSRISRWINEKDMPSRAYCRRLAEILDADPNYVLALAGHEPIPELDIDLDDPLTQFSLANADKLTAEQKRLLVELAKTWIREES